MHRFLRLSVLTSLLLTAGHSMAQVAPGPPPASAPAPASASTPVPAVASPTAPSRSVAVLVDVSGSVSAEYAVEARTIVSDIVTGRGFRAGNGWVSNYDAPEPVDPAGEDTWPEDEVLKTIFKPYWVDSGQPLKPLTGAGKVLFLSPIGTLKTTVSPPRMWDIASAQEFDTLLGQEYPNRKEDFKDGRTCYYIGVARTADRLLQRSEEGCYLFVVSDEWDDPDSKHSPVPEWMPYLEKAGIYDTNYQRAMVKRFHELKESNRFHLIGRFHKGNRPSRDKGSRSYLRVSWYAIGEKPQPVEPPRVVEGPKPGDPPPVEPPPPLPPPSFGRTLTLLGGLVPANDTNESAKPDASRIKVFDHPDPFIAWQVDGVSASSSDSQFEVSIHKLNDAGRLDSVHHLKPAQLARTSEGRLRGLPAGVSTPALANGIYRVTVEEKSATGAAPAAGTLLEPVATWIEVKTPFNWVPWALGISVLGAAGVIGYSVWSLRR
ncbi:MAG TPA: hypothetical protein VG796_18805 [Verrucomicrobiales bacterium]|nr:hypothetical protein [Verrucomicrobiales bacterium]